MSVVSEEQAYKEVKEFLDFMEVTEAGREVPEVKAVITGMVESIQKGRLTIDKTADKTVIVQKLLHKVGDATTELTYDPRFEVGVYHKALKSLAQTDQIGRTIAKLSVLSKQHIGVIERLSREDYNVASLIAVFF